MFHWEIIGYIGVFFAAIYRIPQIAKIYKTKKGGDVSKKSFILQNGAYLAFVIYILFGKPQIDYILLIYYSIGFIQNLMILGMKKYYKKNQNESIKNQEVK